MDAESITLVLNAWILAFRKLFEDIGLDRVVRRRLRKALVFKYDSLNQNVAYRTKCSIKGLLEIFQQPLFYEKPFFFSKNRQKKCPIRGALKGSLWL